jgi:transcriptional regulator with XRE-family HTH domain
MPMDPDRLIARRNELDMTQQQVANAAGMKQQEYARLESGGRLNPRIETLESVAGALRCRIDDLLKPARKRRGAK